MMFNTEGTIFNKTFWGLQADPYKKFSRRSAKNWQTEKTDSQLQEKSFTKFRGGPIGVFTAPKLSSKFKCAKITTQPGLEPPTSHSLVRCVNHYTKRASRQLCLHCQ